MCRAPLDEVWHLLKEVRAAWFALPRSPIEARQRFRNSLADLEPRFMFDGSDTVVLYNELAYEEFARVKWVPLTGSVDAAQAASFTERNVRLLQALAANRGPRLIRQTR